MNSSDAAVPQDSTLNQLDVGEIKAFYRTLGLIGAAFVQAHFLYIGVLAILRYGANIPIKDPDLSSFAYLLHMCLSTEK